MKFASILLLLFPFQAICQTGPGGVGTKDGTSALEFWYDAFDLDGDGDISNNPSNGSAITIWNDKSGNNLHANSTGTNDPVYLAAATNGFPGIDFSSNDDRLNISGMPIGLNASFYIVFEHTNQSSGGSNLRSLFTENGSVGDWSLHITESTSSTLVFKYPNSSNLETLPTLAKNGNPQLLSLYGTGGTGQDYISNTSQGATTTYNKTSGFATDYYIGGDPSNSTREYQGYITEIIGFSAENNAAQKIIIANYLAAKYNLSLSTADIYTQDNSGNFDYDVAGIGRVNASSIHSDAQGTGTVRMLNPGNLGDDEFLIWGHNNGVMLATETTDVPAPVQARFNRLWRVNEVSSAGASVDVGSIDIRFDLTGLGDVTASDLRLLVDTDNDGVFNDETSISGASSLGGDIYQFAGVTAIGNNMRFTLGTINVAQTPLPVEFLSFHARVIDHKQVFLDWQTTSEKGNAYFTIERSRDAQNWDELIKVDGAGTSFSTLHYTSRDENPYSGNSYYRLKQTNFDGQYSYAPIQSVTLNHSESAPIAIYPNPASHRITISGNETELQQVAICNLFGQDVTHLARHVSNGESTVVMDISQLSAGLYCLKTKYFTTRLIKQ